MQQRHLAKTVLLALGLIAFCPLKAAPLVNWAEWAEPVGGYPFPFNWSGGTYGSGSSVHADGVTGTLDLPDGTTVDVTLTGEVLGESCFATELSGCPGTNTIAQNVPRIAWWKNRGWDSNDFSPNTFISENVPNTPDNQHLITMTGYAPTYTRHTLTFSKPVSNIVMNIVSLGDVGAVSAYEFVQDFNILSFNTNINAIQPLIKEGKTLSGQESAGTIQFVGTFESIEWNVTVPEYFSGFNFGVTSEDTYSLTLRNQWRPGVIEGDTMQVVAAAAGTDDFQASVSSTAQAAGNSDQGETLAVNLGHVFTFPAPTYIASENARYRATLSCTNDGQPRELDGNTFPYQLTVAETDKDIVCEYVISNASFIAPVPTHTAAGIVAMTALIFGVFARRQRHRFTTCKRS